MPTIYLYIPFSENEDPVELQKMAAQWQKIYLRKQEMKEALSENSDNTYVPKQIVICTSGDKKIKDVKSGDSIYILAHGMVEQTSVCHSRGSTKYSLTQDQIAKRIIDDGLPGNTAFKLKLYFCDESDNALARMEEFFAAFDTHKKQIDYDGMSCFYYPGVILNTPTISREQYLDPSKAHKRAFVQRNLLELKKTELQSFLKETLANMDPETLKDFLASLGLEVIMKLLTKADPTTLKLIQEKAEISNTKHFLSTLKSEQVYSPTVYLELGKAKKFRKKFET